MGKMIIVLVVHNQKEMVRASLESIRTYGDVEDLEVVVVNNGSSDGVGEWASGEDDFTYVDMETDKELPFGRVINQVREALGLRGDLLIANGSFVCTPHCLSCMCEALHKREDIGAVGDNYEIADGGLFHGIWKQVLELKATVILFREEALMQAGPLDEEIVGQEYVLKEYCLRMLSHGLKLFNCSFSSGGGLIGELVATGTNVCDRQLLEQKSGVHYIGLYNSAILNLVESERRFTDEMDVLEIGCNVGSTLLEIKNRFPNARVYGSEINERAIQIASKFATVKVDNISQCKLEFGEQKFDYIIFGDVLEHLSNPLEVLVYCKKLLKTEGAILASIPNLLNVTVMEQLLQGNFPYGEEGLLDKTHIHFFTFNEIVAMFVMGGYDIEKIIYTSNALTPTQEELVHRLLEFSPALLEHMLRTFQYIVSARREN